MKKRLIAIFLILVLSVSVLPLSAAAGSLSNFAKVNTYQTGQFTDVSKQWFAPYIQAVYEYGLVNGKTPKTFEPDSNLTLAEAIKLAACLHSIYNTGSASFSVSSPWYQSYVDYALSNGIISSPLADYNANATRADFARIFASALPAEALNPMNRIDDNAIPDVKLSDDCGPAVYKLYRAGVLTGSDTAGTYYPDSSITRAAMSAIAARMANADYRQPLTLTAKTLSSTEIAAKCMPAVFYIEAYDKQDEYLRSGSGFFISSSGMAVTNYHIMNGASYAKIWTKENKMYEVSGMYDYSKTNDLTIIQIKGDNFPYLTLGSSDAVSSGSTIYAISYPLGIDETVTQGIISNANHVVNNKTYIMITASISPGSSGGALIDTNGNVIGVTSGYYKDAQNLNVAVPINLLSSLKRTNSTPLYLLPDNTKAKLSFDKTSVTVAVGKTVTVVITEESGIYDVKPSVDNESVVSYTSGYWTDPYTTSITIKGLAAGSAKVTIDVVDSKDTVVTSGVINVTVT
jgi:hypothetical protein